MVGESLNNILPNGGVINGDESHGRIVFVAQNPLPKAVSLILILKKCSNEDNSKIN